MGDQWDRIEVAHRYHAAVQPDFLIWQRTPLCGEVADAIGQQVDKLRFKAICGKFRKAVSANFRRQAFKIALILFGDGLDRQGLQQVREIGRFKAMRICKPFCKPGFHFIGQVPVGGANLLAVGLRYVKQIVQRETCVFVDTDGNTFRL